MARWLLGAFEVAVPTAIVSVLTGSVGTVLALAVSRAIGNDLTGTLVSQVIWGPIFAIVGAYLALRFLAR